MRMYNDVKWRNRYLLLAKHFSTWSKDPSTQVGAVAVSDYGLILSEGWNGFPRGIQDTQDRLGDRQIKYNYMVHSEKNLIYNATYNGVSLLNSNLYVYGLPVCSECAKGVIQVGIKSVYVLTDSMNIRDTWVESWKKTTDMFDEVGIHYEWITMDHGPDWN
jgi:dCMP deaminase